MISSLPDYFKYIRHDKTLLLISTSQVIVFILVGMLFFKYIPWILSRDIHELSLYGAQTESPPVWAKAFSVNHGVFHFYADSPAVNKPKAMLIAGCLIVGWLFLVSTVMYANKRAAWLSKNNGIAGD